MKKLLLNESEKKRIKLLYESKGILLSEDKFPWARRLTSFLGKNEDDIVRLFKTTEVALAKYIDDVVGVATKQKSISSLEELQQRLMHCFNPSNLESGIPKAQKQMDDFLFGYAKSKGKSGWKQIQDEVKSGTTAPRPAQAAYQAPSQAASNAVRDTFKGQRISNRWYGWKPENIDFTKFSNKMSFDDLNKAISTAIKTNNWNLVPRAGFEKLGITNMREYLQNNIAKINELDPSTGRWSVMFK